MRPQVDRWWMMEGEWCLRSFNSSGEVTTGSPSRTVLSLVWFSPTISSTPWMAPSVQAAGSLQSLQLISWKQRPGQQLVMDTLAGWGRRRLAAPSHTLAGSLTCGMHTLLPPCSTSRYQRLQKDWCMCNERHGRGCWLQNCLRQKELETPYLFRGVGSGCCILHVGRVSRAVQWQRLP